MSTSSTSTNTTNEKGEPRELKYDKNASNATGETPSQQATATQTVDVKEVKKEVSKAAKKGNKKGIGTGVDANSAAKSAKADTDAVPAALKKVLAEATCGFCNNSLANNSEGATVVPVQGKKIPKVDGQFIYETPGQAKGTMAGVLCGSCSQLANDARYIKPDGTSYIDVKHVLVVRKGGGVANIPVSDLDYI